MLLSSHSSTDRPSVTTTAWNQKGKLTFVYLCVVYLLNSTERGTLPATLYAQANSTKRMSIQATFGLTGTEVGSFESFYVAGLTLFLILWSALFKWLKKPFLVLSLGYTVWLVACAGSAFSQEYTQFAISRFLCGAGDAAMSVLGVPWVDANAPSESRARLVAVFSMMFILGDSMGLILSAYVTSWSLNAYGWRTCYASIGLLTAPLIFLGYFLDRINPSDSLRDTEDVTLEDGKEANRRWAFLKGTVQLLKHPLVVLAILGTAALQAMVAIVGYYTNGYMIQSFNVPQSEAGVSLGFTLLFSTFLGVPIGGIILDRVGRRRGGKTASMAFLQGSVFSFFGVILQLIAFLWAEKVTSFLASLALAYTCFMIGAAATTPGTLWLVQPQNRVILSGLVGFGFNILGKIPGPLVIGALLDSRNRGHIPTRDELVYAPLWVLWCVVLWGLVAAFAQRWEVGERVDFEREDEPFKPKTTYESIE